MECNFEVKLVKHIDLSQISNTFVRVALSQQTKRIGFIVHPDGTEEKKRRESPFYFLFSGNCVVSTNGDGDITVSVTHGETCLVFEAHQIQEIQDKYGELTIMLRPIR